MSPLAAANFWLPTVDALSRFGPLWVLAGTVCAVLVGALIYGRRAQPTAAVALIGAALTAMSCVSVRARAVAGGWAGLAPDGRAPMLLVDGFSIFFTLLVSLFLVAVIGLWWFGYRGGQSGMDMHASAPEFFVLLLASAVGMVLMVSTTNLLLLILAVEMASLPSYALAGFEKRSRLGAEASVKYVLFGGITSAIMVYGVSLLYGQFQTLDLAVIAHQLADGTRGGTLAAIALFGLMVGIGFKISAVPFHFWCPDVFQGAAIEVTTWLSVASKAAGLGLLLRVMGVAAAAGIEGGFASGLSIGVGIFAAITCTVGNFCALHQTNIKRLLAYSSIAHAGYMLMAGAILAGVSPDMAHPAFTALTIYLIVYLFMNLGAFGVAAMVYWSSGEESLSGYTALGRRQPFLAVVMTVCLVSLVGLPPFGGFTAKYWLLINVWGAGLIWLVVVAVLNTALSLYFYMRVIRQMWLIEGEGPAIRAPLAAQALVGICAAVILWTGTLAIDPIRRRAEGYARSLFLGQPVAAEAQATPPADAEPGRLASKP